MGKNQGLMNWNLHLNLKIIKTRYLKLSIKVRSTWRKIKDIFLVFHK